jgi:hypothetical protein
MRLALCLPAIAWSDSDWQAGERSPATLEAILSKMSTKSLPKKLHYTSYQN